MAQALERTHAPVAVDDDALEKPIKNKDLVAGVHEARRISATYDEDPSLEDERLIIVNNGVLF